MISSGNAIRRQVRKKNREAKEERDAIVAMLRHRAGVFSAEADKLHDGHYYSEEQLTRSDASMIREVIRWIRRMP